MMYALERYNQLVNVRLAPLLEEEEVGLDSNIFKECIELSSREKENIKGHLLRKAVTVRKKKELELLIQQYQAEIIQLLDIVFTGKVKYGNGPAARLFDSILEDLEEALFHIERRYEEYFNFQEKVPARFLSVTQSELEERINKLKEFCSTVFENERLIKAVFDPLNRFTRLEGNVSYRRMMYVKELVSELEEWAGEKEGKADQPSFLEVLMYMNFNIGRFVGFMIDEIENAVDCLPESHQKIERLADYLKQCNQAVVKPDVSCRPNALPLKNQIANWIKEELTCLEMKLRRFPTAPVPPNEGVREEKKLHLDTSVEVLALIVRAAKDSNLILNKELTVTFQTLSKLVRTSNSKAPSANSLLKKSYGGQNRAKKAAIDVLYEMIKHLNKY